MGSESGPADTALTAGMLDDDFTPKAAPLPPPAGHAYMRGRLEEEAFSFEFFQAVRLLERINPERSPVGEYSPPQQEVARFKVHQQISFPASEIQKIEFKPNGQAEVTVNFMGLTGPQGVLPLYYTEYLRERFRQRDYAAAGFFDVFNHRMISLFFKAWEKYRFPIAYERGDRDRFSHILLDLIGMGTPGLQNRMALVSVTGPDGTITKVPSLPDDSLIFYTGLLSQRNRPAVGLANLIADYFAVPCEVEQFVGAWYALSPDSLCEFQMGNELSEQLGIGAVLGDEVYDQQSAVRLVIGPLNLQQYRDFLPDGSAHQALQELARFYSGPAMDFEVQLILAMAEVPASHTGLDGEPPPNLGPFLDEVQLGWTTWVKTRPRTADAFEAVLRF